MAAIFSVPRGVRMGSGHGDDIIASVEPRPKTGVGWVGVGFVSAGLFIEVAASFFAFYLARKRVLPHAAPPTMIREAELHSQNRIIPGGWIAASGPFVLLAACTGYLWIHRAQLDPGAGGQPNGSAIHYLTVYLLSTAAHLVLRCQSEIVPRIVTGSWVFSISTEMIQLSFTGLLGIRRTRFQGPGQRQMYLSPILKLP